MGNSKIIYNDETLIDLTEDTVSADTLLLGVAAHDASGEKVIGTVNTLPNPNKLTFTGAVSAEYDGSEAVTVNIPVGGAGGVSGEDALFTAIYDETTYAEVVEAYNAGKAVIAIHTVDSSTRLYILSRVEENACQFHGANWGDQYVMQVTSANVWGYYSYKTLPNVSAADDGKVLAVVDGAWSAKTPSSGDAAYSVVVADKSEITDNTLIVIDPNATPDKIPEWYNGTLVTSAGKTVVDGSAAGDYYINTDTFDVYYATAPNTWKYTGNIKGGNGSAGIYIGDSEAEANASGATIWINSSALTDDSYVTEDYVTNAMAFKGIKVNSPAAIGSTSSLQTANTEATQIYSTVEYNSDPSMFSYDSATGKITVNRAGYYELTASGAIRTLTGIASIYGTMRIKYDKTAIGGAVGNVKSMNWPMCQTNSGATQGTAYPNITVTAYMEAGTSFYVTVGCVLGTWCATEGSGYSFAVTYLGGNNTASEHETLAATSGIKYKISDGEWVDLFVPSVIGANAEVMTIILELIRKINTVTTAAKDMQRPIIEIVRSANDDHLYVMQGGVSDGHNIYFYYYVVTADRTAYTEWGICKYSIASGTLLKSAITTGQSVSRDEYNFGPPTEIYPNAYYHGNDMTYNPNTGQLFILGYYDAEETRIHVINTDTLELESTVTISGVGLSSIAYNSALDRYIGAVRGVCNVQVFDSNWTYIKTVTMPDRLSEGWSKQGIECDANYIYVPYWTSGTDRNIIDVCDWNGNLVKTWDLSNMTGLHEIEWLCKKDDDTFYVGACGSSDYELLTVFEVNTVFH